MNTAQAVSLRRVKAALALSHGSASVKRAMAELADLRERQDAFENALRVAATEVQLLKSKVE